MKTKYNIVYFSSENVDPIVLKSNDDETFFKDFDGAYLSDNVTSNFEAVEKLGYGFFKAQITVDYYWDGELHDIRIDNIEPVEVVFGMQPPKKSKEL